MTTKFIGRRWPDFTDILHMDAIQRTLLRDELDAAQAECDFFDFGNPEVCEFVSPNGKTMEDVYWTEIMIDRTREILNALPMPEE